jgi:hypothetical protein
MLQTQYMVSQKETARVEREREREKKAHLS